MTPNNLSLWARPVVYDGPDWSEYYVFLSCGQFSCVEDTDKFEDTLYELKDLATQPHEVLRVHEDTEYGWVEWIAIHQNAHAALEWADLLAAELLEGVV